MRAPTNSSARLLVLLAAVASPAALGAPMPVDTQELLARMDSDGDGRIDRAEYRAWLSRGFRAMDANGDGVLQPEELPPGTRFRRGMALTEAEHGARLDARFALQDVDRSGFLDARELAAPPQP